MQPESNILTAEDLRRMQRELAVVQEKLDNMQVSYEFPGQHWGTLVKFIETVSKWASTSKPNKRVIEKVGAALLAFTILNGSTNVLQDVVDDLDED